jgi:serine/threonine protein phosphatase PrpC
MELCDQCALDLEEVIMQDSLEQALWTLGTAAASALLLVLLIALFSLLLRRKPQQARVGSVSFTSQAGAIQREAKVLPAAPSVRPTLSAQKTRVDADAPRRSLGLDVGALSESGRIHLERENEDSFLSVTGARIRSGRLQPFGLFVVADGVSGCETGHDASRLTLLAISQRFVPMLTRHELPDEELAPLLAAAIQSANRTLYQHNQRDYRPLGCTVTAALLTDRLVTICHVGKNRVYLLPEQSPLRRVTIDHSIVESLVVAGFIKRDEVYTHPTRNRIFRCLGQMPQVEIDTIRLPAANGDRLLLCSDGLWEVLRDPTLEAVLREHPDATQAANRLVTLAKERGGLDDITALLVNLTDVPGLAKRPGIAQIWSNRMNLVV